MRITKKYNKNKRYHVLMC